MPPSSFFDGTKFIEPNECNKCRESAYVIRRALHPNTPHVEVQTFQCPRCGHIMVFHGKPLRNRVARLLQLASEARANGRHAVADQFTERAAELLDQIVSEELASVRTGDQ
jgi:hypothetical protein